MPNHLKFCPKCNQTQEASKFNRRSRGKDGLHYCCKSCASKIRRENLLKNPNLEEIKKTRAVKDKARYDANREKILAQKKEYSQKNREVLREKSYKHYYKDLEHSRLLGRTYHHAHKEANNLKSKRYYAGHLGQAAAVNKKYWLKNKDKLRENGRKYRENNKEYLANKVLEWQRKNKTHLREYFKTYYRLNPEKRLQHVYRRRAARLGNGGSHTFAQWNYIKEINGNRCLMCGLADPNVKLTKDHIVPISKGGSDDIGNIQPLCLSCNARKSTKIVDFRK